MLIVEHCFCCELLAWPPGERAERTAYKIIHISKIEHTIDLFGVTLDAYLGYMLIMAERGRLQSRTRTVRYV